MMEAAFRPPARTGARPDWMEPFARTIDTANKYVVSSTLDRVDRNAELVRGDLGKAVQQLKRESGKGLFARSEASQKRNQRCLVCRTEFRQKLQAGNRALGDARRTPGLSLILGIEARRIEQLLESENRRVVQ
jgi:hypothetical protein